jgi:hypothetical protein
MLSKAIHFVFPIIRSFFSRFLKVLPAPCSAMHSYRTSSYARPLASALTACVQRGAIAHGCKKGRFRYTTLIIYHVPIGRTELGLVHEVRENDTAAAPRDPVERRWVLRKVRRIPGHTTQQRRQSVRMVWLCYHQGATYHPTEKATGKKIVGVVISLD